MHRYSVRFHAFTDHGTGFTSEQQREWLSRSLETVRSTILGSVPDWADSDEPGYNNLALANSRSGEILWVECARAIDLESLVKTAMGRDSAYAAIHEFTRGGTIGFGETIDDGSIAYKDSKGDRLANPTGGPLGWTKEEKEIWPSDFQIPVLDVTHA